MMCAADIIAALHPHVPDLRQAGVRHLSLFGSVARGDATADSDIDIAAEFDPATPPDLFRLSRVQRQLSAILGQPVDLLPEPVARPALRQALERDRVRVF